MKTLKRLIAILSLFLLTSCGVNWYVSTLNHVAHDPLYGELVEQYPEKIDTLSVRDFKWKLRTDFNFRWDYANYMMNQPLSFYYRNWSPWRNSPYNAWWNSHQIWTDWAFNYPYNSWWGMGNVHGGWYSNTWNNHWYQYGYSGWYGHDSMLWGWNRPWSTWGQPNYWRSNNVNYAYINGRRGSVNIYNRTNSNIEQDTNRRRNYNNNNENRPNNVISNGRNGLIIRNADGSIRVFKPTINENDGTRVYVRPQNNNIIINNNNSRPRINNNSINNRPPVINNSRPVRVEQNTRTNYNTNRSNNVRSTNSRSNGNNKINRRD